MDAEYADWIAAYTGLVQGMCAEVTEQMAADFPELTRVRGRYHCPAWGERQHWWLKTEAGTIIDPTASQFPSRGAGDYVEWVAGDPEPIGECLNCGEGVFENATVCGLICANELLIAYG